MTQPENTKGDDVRLRGHESEMRSFNFFELGICRPECVVMFETVAYVLASRPKLPVSDPVLGR